MKLTKIAITGGIGSGKSLALATLKENGYCVLSSDQIVWELYKKRCVLAKVKKLFPTAVNGLFRLTLNKSVLSELAFKNEANHTALTSLITPLVMKEIKARLKGKTGVYFVEVPLLFECSYQDYFDGVWVIMRDKNTRINAVKQRSNLSEQEIIRRMNRQVDYNDIDFSSYTVLYNDLDVDAFKQQLLLKASLIKNKA